MHDDEAGRRQVNRRWTLHDLRNVPSIMARSDGGRFASTSPSPHSPLPSERRYAPMTTLNARCQVNCAFMIGRFTAQCLYKTGCAYDVILPDCMGE